MKAIFDLEWTTKNNFREIIQIGYIIFDDKINHIFSKNSHYIFPYFNKEISKHVTNLTGISNKMISIKGKKFNNVIRKFIKDMDKVQIIYSNGFDINILSENINKHSSTNLNLKKKQFMNIRFRIAKLLKSGYHDFSSSDLIKFTKLKKNLVKHNAIDDCLSIYYFLKENKDNLNL